MTSWTNPLSLVHKNNIFLASLLDAGQPDRQNGRKSSVIAPRIPISGNRYPLGQVRYSTIFFHRLNTDKGGLIGLRSRRHFSWRCCAMIAYPYSL